MTPEEARLLVDTGTGVTVTPVVEATMGHGLSVWGTFAAAGGRAGIGTDVPVGAPPDLFEPLRDTLRANRPRPAAGFLATATADGARAIGSSDHIGTLEPGKRADLVLFSGLSHLPPGADPAGAIVTCLGTSDVHTVIVDGRIVKRDGRLTALDLPGLRRANAERLTRFVA